MRFWIFIASLILGTVSVSASTISASHLIGLISSAHLVEGSYELQLAPNSGAQTSAYSVSKPKTLLLDLKGLGLTRMAFQSTNTGVEIKAILEDGSQFLFQDKVAAELHQELMSLVRAKRLRNSTITSYFSTMSHFNSLFSMINESLITRITFEMGTSTFGPNKLGVPKSFELVSTQGKIFQIEMKESNGKIQIELNVLDSKGKTQSFAISDKAKRTLLSLLFDRAAYFKRFFLSATNGQNLGSKSVTLDLIPIWELDNNDNGREKAWKQAKRHSALKTRPVLCRKISQSR